MTRGCLAIRLSTKTQLALCLQRQCDHRPVYKAIRDRHKSSASASRLPRAMLSRSLSLSPALELSLVISAGPDCRWTISTLAADRLDTINIVCQDT
ncbi:hypothetical protein RDWZM_001714 [Blomia tropicalis]|uniref:Uncharacterized protein n=1 Tax=Blomia tropicalis TaxID=40697 RepID=A0A9Q0MCG3_BLOTA|nr:hypothetical protein RDWZM_001714 [Blomia tropicalis]